MKPSTPQISARLLAASVEVAVEEVDRDTIARRLSVGSTLGARILEHLGANKYVVGFAGLRMIAESSVPLPVGERVGVQVAAMDPKIHLRILASDAESMDRILRDMGFEKSTEEMRAIVGELMNRGEAIDRETVRQGADLVKRGVPPREAALLATSDLPATEDVVALAKYSRASVAAALDRLTGVLSERGAENLAQQLREALTFDGDLGALFEAHPLNEERRLLAGPGRQELATVLRELLADGAVAADAKTSDLAARVIALLEKSGAGDEKLLFPSLKKPSLDNYLSRAAQLFEQSAEAGGSGSSEIAQTIRALRDALASVRGVDENKILAAAARTDAKAILLELAGDNALAADARAKGPGAAPAADSVAALARDKDVADAARNLLNTLEAHYLLGEPQPHIPFVVEDGGGHDASLSAVRSRGRTHIRFNLPTSALGEVVGIVDIEKKAVGVSIGVRDADARKALLAAAPQLDASLRALGLRIDALTVDVVDRSRPSASRSLAGLDVKA